MRFGNLRATLSGPPYLFESGRNEFYQADQRQKERQISKGGGGGGVGNDFLSEAGKRNTIASFNERGVMFN